MDIDKIDFTPFYFARRSPHAPAIISRDECTLLGLQDSILPPSGVGYLNKLIKYHERFDNHMPVPIRKMLLVELLSTVE